MSGVILGLLPNRPADAAWLSAPEKDWIARRLAADAALTGAQDHGFWRALVHPRVLQLGAVNFLLLGGFYAFTLSAPTVLDGATHLGAAKVGYLIAFSGVLGAAAMVANGWHSDRTQERYFHLIVPFALMAAAFGVLSLSPTPVIAMLAYLTAIAANAAIGAVFWLVPGDLLHPRSTGVSIGAINAIGQSGSFFAPFAWGLAKDHTGDFHAGLTALPAAFLIAGGIVLFIRFSARSQRQATVLAMTAS
jgi:ACS family tartrate transporter-like MFS transporter